ncbi:alpha/beta hydrolase family protein [Butyrivibrio sp. MC2013]|uniref:alpha/beta hydrolase family protein n=1 Tax=Butyrivibrio sp. MC2013 TaxID=1280686 RepID=UPI0009DBBE97|nr:alpha/beta fold hydrolase [Butyrivibrio sp. MC2013]
MKTINISSHSKEEVDAFNAHIDEEQQLIFEGGKRSIEKYLESDGIPLHIKEDLPDAVQDKMPALIVIHGFTGHMEEDHIRAVAGLATDLGMVSIRAEMYGHGLSGGDFYDHNVMIWVMEIVRVIRYVRRLPYVSDIYLTGHSQGGLSVVLAAGIMRDVVKALIPLSPAINIYNDAASGFFLGNEFDSEHIPDSIGSDEWELSSDSIRVASLLPVHDAVKAYKRPVLVVHGDDDEAVPYSCGAELAAEYSDARLATIHGDDHCYTRHLDKVVEAVKDFLAKELKN